MLTEKEKEYFQATRPLTKMEVALVRHVVDNAGSLTRTEENTLRYALNMARLGPFRTPSGADIDLFDELTPFRRKVTELLSAAMGSTLDSPDPIALVRAVPVLQEEILLARYQLLDNHADEFGEEHLDREICEKALVNVAGGGGGSGMVYVGAYKLLEDHGLKPDYIVGASVGAMIGALRAYFKEFDLALLSREINRAGISVADLFMIRPSMGQARFGLPSAVRLELYPVAEKLFRGLGSDVPTFSDLPVPFHAVVAGIKRGGLRYDKSHYAAGAAPTLSEKGSVKIRLNTVKWFVRSVFSIMREFSTPETLVELVFGRDNYTDNLKVVDGVGFSCAVPGLLHYDIFRYDPETVKKLVSLMEEHDLISLVDGGAVNNVPSRVAWESVYRGVVGKRNAFILAFDSFSPQVNRNLLYLPIQRLLNINVRANLHYSTYTKAFTRVPNPVHMVGRPRTLMRMFKRGVSELTPELPFIHRMLAPLEGPRMRFGAR